MDKTARRVERGGGRMRVATRLVIVAGIGASLAWAPQAQAAQSGRILVSGFSGASVARNYWAILNRCSPAAMAAVNGTDAAFFSVSGYPAGSVLNIDWTGTVGLGGSLSPQFFSSSCDPIQTSASGTTQPGVMRTPVPAGARWLVVDGTFVVNVSLTLR